MPRYSRYQGAAGSDYQGLRQVLAPPYRNWEAGDIEALFESYNLSAEDMEGFFDTLKDIGKAVVSVAPAILPVAGTVVGSAFGGPLGGHSEERSVRQRVERSARRPHLNHKPHRPPHLACKFREFLSHRPVPRQWRVN